MTELGAYHRRAADPASGAGRLCPDAAGTWRGTDNIEHAAVVAMLMTERADFAALLPHFDFAAGGIILRFCNGLLVAIAVKLSRVGNAILVVEEIQTIVCHNPSVVALGAAV
jgi:hypothetical protein